MSLDIRPAVCDQAVIQSSFPHPCYVQPGRPEERRTSGHGYDSGDDGDDDASDCDDYTDDDDGHDIHDGEQGDVGDCDDDADDCNDEDGKDGEEYDIGVMMIMLVPKHNGIASAERTPDTSKNSSCNWRDDSSIIRA